MGACCMKLRFGDGYSEVQPDELIGRAVTHFNVACNGIPSSEVERALAEGRQEASCLELRLAPPVREGRDWISIEPIERKNARHDYAAHHGNLALFVSAAELGDLREGLPLVVRAVTASAAPSPLTMRLELAREGAHAGALALTLRGEYRDAAHRVHPAVTGTEWQVREALDPAVSAKFRSPPGGYLG